MTLGSSKERPMGITGSNSTNIIGKQHADFHLRIRCFIAKVVPNCERIFCFSD